MLQAVWEPDAEQEDLYRWDAVIDGKQWYYDASTNKYRYVVVDEHALTFAGLNDAFEVDDEEIEDLDLMTGKVKTQANKDLSYGFYFNAADDDALQRFDPLSLKQKLTDRASVHCLNYIFMEDSLELEKAAAAEIGNENPCSIAPRHRSRSRRRSMQSLQTPILVSGTTTERTYSVSVPINTASKTADIGFLEPRPPS